MSLDEAKETTSPAYVDDVAAQSGKKTTFGQKLRRNCARFWWLYLIIFIIVVLVVVLPIIYVGYPNMAQDDVNKSVLNVTSMDISDPAPDAVNFKIDTVLTTHSSHHPTLSAWNGSLHLEKDSPAFAYIQIPETKALNGTVTTIDQRVQIANLTEYTKYVGTVLASEELSIYLKGKGGLKLGGLPKTTVDYRKEIAMKGFNHLAGFNLTEFNILTTAQPDGANANGTISIPNPTVLTVEMGTVTLAMSVDGAPVGQATIESMTLVPGDNSFAMRAVTNQSAVVGLIFNQYKNGTIPIDVVGNTTTNAQGQTLPYYQIPLQMNPLRLNLDVIAALERANLTGILGINTTTSAR